MDLGGIARVGAIAARAAVKDRRPPSGGEGVPALVLDGEHEALGLIGQSEPAPSFFVFFYIRVTSRASLKRCLAMERFCGFRWLSLSVSLHFRQRERFLRG
jgi:hypothetical protein